MVGNRDWCATGAGNRDQLKRLLEHLADSPRDQWHRDSTISDRRPQFPAPPGTNDQKNIVHLQHRMNNRQEKRTSSG